MGFTSHFRRLDACQRVSHFLRNDALCYKLEQERLHTPSCTEGFVPLRYHAIGPRRRPRSVLMNAAANPSFALNYHDDVSGAAYVRRHCGDRVATAFGCFAAPANRADLFRFCALYAEGGVYLDADLISLVPLQRIVSPCAGASVGRDVPQKNLPGVQMKAIGGAPRHPLFQCMIDRIVSNVARRSVPPLPLLVSGPSLLSECYRNHSSGAVTTYIDARESYWPYSGLRTRDELLAYEVPNEERHYLYRDASYYLDAYLHNGIYTPGCTLR